MYIHREIQSTIDKMLEQGKVVLVTGARQVGKTTMLTHHLNKRFHYVSMEDPREFLAAKQDALLFFENQDFPLIIDEVQRVPELFSTVKFLVDQSDERGQVVLTGSQTYHLMKGVSESLAGRIRILEMSGLSLRELEGNSTNVDPYLPSKIKESRYSKDTKRSIWEIIHRGAMPELQDPIVDWAAFYASYMGAYMERDVRDLTTVKDEAKFYSFVVACAARSGQLFNASDVAAVVGVDYKTVQSWLSILQASGIVRLLHPFYSNVNKRLTKMPKLYFMDTGIVCYLTSWNTPEQLKNGAAAGHLFETFVVSEVLKSYMNAGRDLKDIWFYRDSKKREIDLVIQDGHVLHPVEIKAGMTVGSDACKNFRLLEQFHDYQIGFGTVVCQTDRPYMIEKDVQAVSVWDI